MAGPAHRLSTLILAGGNGDRLYPLTKYRAKPAVPFGGIYRIIDFTLSNCINSGIRRIHVLTQYKSHSLAHHIKMGWNVFHPELNEYIDLIPAQKRVGNHWYRGTADAVFQNFYTLEQENPDFVLLLAGDHIYKMDYGRMLASHIERGADVTVGVVDRPKEESLHFGVVQTADGDRIRGFEEKPKQPATIPKRPDRILASMGIYIFSTPVLFEELLGGARPEDAHDFGKHILPRLVGHRRLFAHRFTNPNPETEAYWRDIGTLDAYYRANMDLLSVRPRFDLYDAAWPIRTYQPQCPPAKLVIGEEGRDAGRGLALDSILSGGCVVAGGCVIRSVLSHRVRVRRHARVEDSVLLEGVVVGRGAKIRNAIIDKFVTIPDGTTIGYDRREDERRFPLTPSGIVVVEKRMTIPSESVPVRREQETGSQPTQPVFLESAASYSESQASL